MILLFGLRPDARALAVAEMVLQADVVFSAGDLLGFEVETASAERVDLADELQHGTLHGDRGVWPEILRPVADDPPC